MTPTFQKGTTIVVGVSGGIAAYKAADLVSRLVQNGALVRVIMTEHATRFITPLTLATLSGQPVLVGTFEESSSGEIAHIRIMEDAAAVIIAPATANTIAKLARGIADDLLSTAMLMARCPVLVAPAMNVRMYEHPATRENLAILAQRGYTIVGPEAGHLACGDVGEGRMAEPETIVALLEAELAKRDRLKSVPILVTAGATREHWDPVRFLSNPSTGKMGYSLAEEAARRGAKVTLVSAPSSLPPPAGVSLVPVTSAEEMRAAVMSVFPESRALIAAAAVSDYRPVARSAVKLKKNGRGIVSLPLEPTPDILAEAASRRRRGQILIGFAAETGNLIENARKKLRNKHLDFIVANNVVETGSGFGTDTNRATILYPKGKAEALPLLSKQELAGVILDRLERELKRR